MPRAGRRAPITHATNVLFCRLPIPQGVGGGGTLHDVTRCGSAVSLGELSALSEDGLTRELCLLAPPSPLPAAIIDVGADRSSPVRARSRLL